MQRVTILAGMLALAGCAPPEPSGRELYMQLCAGCHGATGKGDGPAVATMEYEPADLTTIRQRNGGRFPFVEVMATIDGYGRGTRVYGPMPEFWPLLEGKMVLAETDLGVYTPTPARLVALADYVESIQE
ncbi:hypothetical protein Ga0609869_000606 [Rhodovulum iodosum]|uniref:Cytochrome c domain-containing protein n=1 Tax=Rhodovulum iodosum TaxID=68291 RepID=A0ABV3XQ77_9RHOB|nr:c-type cytochrome [Rhodovulum robiginosum]RSK31455.1 c-type cytochrome [Rhodovulum robiginosum]